jgi:hypothetical protein
MNPNEVAQDQTPEETLAQLVEMLHHTGPDTQQKLQTLSLYKEMSKNLFAKYEERILAAMGLFYKIDSPTGLYSFLMNKMGEINKTVKGTVLTPVQASMRRAIEDNKYISISAPTSAGKSYSVRDYILQETADVVIVVPSRALIAEYVASLKDYFAGDKSIMVLPFVDQVFLARKLRRVFVLTPERAREIFTLGAGLDIGVFFFDEAQVSEEARRGVIFDVLVRRAATVFPRAKLIFAHPFVDNPEAQFLKHGLSSSEAFSKLYPQGAVGKVFVFKHNKNGKDYYFSPFQKGGHKITNCLEFQGGFEGFALSGKHSILTYVSKASIYSGAFTKDFSDFISKLPSTNLPDAINIIERIGNMLGADISKHRSEMITLMHKGVVIHHGSVPLEVRFLVEDFIKRGHARLCFATSTLSQGVNMPFDIVWLDNMRMQGEDSGKRALAFKNLIGRAGRLSSNKAFDYGYVYTKSPRLLIDRLSEKFVLSEASILESGRTDLSTDDQETITAIREGEFDGELHMPTSKLKRLGEQSVKESVEQVLAVLYDQNADIRTALRGREKAPVRRHLGELLRCVYEAYLGRQMLEGERAVFREAIRIMLLTFAGRSFREIAGLRFSFISQRDKKDVRTVAFMQQATELPDVMLIRPYPLYLPSTEKQKVSYDVVVFDTYDYLDKVISFCLSDVFVAASRVHYENTKDVRALKFIELLRFGTNDTMHVLMMRYGFLPDQIERVSPYVKRITEDAIEFNDMRTAPENIKALIEWYQ